MTDHVTDMNALTEADFGYFEWGDTVTAVKVDPDLPVIKESLRPKFDSIAAFKLYLWSLDGGQDEETGNAVDWDYWAAIFRDVTQSGSSGKSMPPVAILVTDSQGSVSANWYGDGDAAELAWTELEKAYAEFEDGGGDE